jgi:hypothetical protein
MRGKLFQFAILFHPNTSGSHVLESLGTGSIDTPPSELLVEPQTIVAVSEDEVRILAARKIPDNYTDKIDQIELLIRPFSR